MQHLLAVMEKFNKYCSYPSKIRNSIPSSFRMDVQSSYPPKSFGSKNDIKMRNFK